MQERSNSAAAYAWAQRVGIVPTENDVIDLTSSDYEVID